MASVLTLKIMGRLRKVPAQPQVTSEKKKNHSNVNILENKGREIMKTTH